MLDYGQQISDINETSKKAQLKIKKAPRSYSGAGVELEKLRFVEDLDKELNNNYSQKIFTKNTMQLVSDASNNIFILTTLSFSGDSLERKDICQ